LTRGEIDIFWALQATEVISRLKKEKGFTVISRPANHTINLVLNSKYKPLSDKRVCQAIWYGLNLKSLCEDFFQGTKGIATGVLTSNFPQYTSGVPKYPYDPDKAKKLLEEAGYGKGFSLELISVGLFPYNKIVIPMANDLNKIGIKTKITILERAAYNQARIKGNIPTCITGVVGPPDPDHPLWRLYHTSSFPPGLNTARYDKVDDLLETAQVELDPKKRLALYHKVQKIVAEDVPVIPLYEDRLFLAFRNNVKGLTLNSLFTLYVYPVKME